MTTEDRMTLASTPDTCKTKTRKAKPAATSGGWLVHRCKPSRARLQEPDSTDEGPSWRKPHTKQQDRAYDAEVVAALEVISASLDCPGAEQPTSNLVWMTEHLAVRQELEISVAGRDRGLAGPHLLAPLSDT